MLDSQEMEAIRSAMQIAGGVPAGASEALPVALIADDHAAARVRPDAQRMAARWALAARTRLSRLVRAKLSFELSSVDVIDGGTLRDTLSTCWLRGLDGEGRSHVALVAIRGELIEAMAAWALAGTYEPAETERAPSPTVLRLFQTAGEAVTLALVDALREELGKRLTMLPSEAREDATVRALSDGEPIIAVGLVVRGAANGEVRLYARPESLAATAEPAETPPAPVRAIEAALAEVPIEVRVELGRARLSMLEFSALVPGAVLVLDRSIDEPLPVRIGGIVKATGRVLVSHGMIAVEIAQSNHDSEEHG